MALKAWVIQISKRKVQYLKICTWWAPQGPKFCNFRNKEKRSLALMFEWLLEDGWIKYQIEKCIIWKYAVCELQKGPSFVLSGYVRSNPLLDLWWWTATCLSPLASRRWKWEKGIKLSIQEKSFWLEWVFFLLSVWNWPHYQNLVVSFCSWWSPIGPNCSTCRFDERSPGQVQQFQFVSWASKSAQAATPKNEVSWNGGGLELAFFSELLDLVSSNRAQVV